MHNDKRYGVCFFINSRSAKIVVDIYAQKNRKVYMGGV